MLLGLPEATAEFSAEKFVLPSVTSGTPDASSGCCQSPTQLAEYIFTELTSA